MPGKPNLSRRLGGADFGKAATALAALRRLDRAEGLRHVPAVHAQDAQRDFQIRVARLIAEGGVAAVAAAWPDLSSAEWREALLIEIDQAFVEWVEEGTIELFIAGLEDPEPAVSRRAVSILEASLAERTEKQRRQAAKTPHGKAVLEALDAAATWLTPARRARIARAATAALRRHGENPRELFWPDRFITLLGATATKHDEGALAALEALRPKAGKPYQTQFEKLDRDNLPWPTSILANRKGVPPGTPMARITYIPTGLLDVEHLERAIDQIRQRG